MIAEISSVVSTCSNKATANLCVWLLGVQNLSRSLIITEAKRLLETLLTASANPFNSASIEHETLAVRAQFILSICTNKVGCSEAGQSAQ